METNLTNEERIELIKYFWKYTEFKYCTGGSHGDFLRYPDGDVFNNSINDEFDDNDFGLKIIWPLFLQQVIEGINKKKEWEMMQGNNEIDVMGLYDNTGLDSMFFFEDFESLDQAKEAAIKYIMGQEAKDE